MTSKIIEKTPKFYVGEVVEWRNSINTKYVKIVVIYKLKTQNNNTLFRYAGLKQLSDSRWEYLEKAMVNIIFDENELYKLEYNAHSFWILNNSNIKFEKFNPNNLCLDIITKPNSNNLFAINFKNTISPAIKIKEICESIYSTQVNIVTMQNINRYQADINYLSVDTKFINLKKHNSMRTNWKEYTDVDTLEKIYVNNVHKLTSKEHPQKFLTNKIDEYSDPSFKSETNYSWIKKFRKLICLLETMQCDHIIDIIKECIVPKTKFCLGDIVYNNTYEGVSWLSSIFLEERQRTAKSLHFVVNDMYLIKDQYKLWKPRYLLITLEHNYKLGYCDEDTLGEVMQYKQIIYDKINNLSKYKDLYTTPTNDIYDYSNESHNLNISNKKRKILKVKACRVTNILRQYRSDIYNKDFVCKKIVEPIIF